MDVPSLCEGWDNGSSDSAAGAPTRVSLFSCPPALGWQPALGSSHPLVPLRDADCTGEHQPKPGKGIWREIGETDKMVGADVFRELF